MMRPDSCINLPVRNSLWALRDDDSGGQAARARLTRHFDFIRQPVTVRVAQTQTQTRLTRKEKQNLASDFFATAPRSPLLLAQCGHAVVPAHEGLVGGEHAVFAGRLQESDLS